MAARPPSIVGEVMVHWLRHFIFNITYILIAQSVASLRSKSIALVSGLAGLPLLAFCLGIQPLRLADIRLPWYDAWAGLTVLTITWAICYFHRCDRVPKVAPRSADSPTVAAASIE